MSHLKVGQQLTIYKTKMCHYFQHHRTSRMIYQHIVNVQNKKCEIISETKHLCNLFIYTIKALFCVLNKYKCTHDLTNMSYTRKRWYNQNRSVEPHQRLPMFPWARHLTSLLSTGWFKERIWAWFHNRAKIN